MADEAAPAKGGGALRGVVLWLVIAALLAAVWWLASERNERRYQLAVRNNALVIEKGRFFPTGTTAAADKIYAPVPIPAGEKAPAEREFDEQNELDRYLFDIISGWAKKLEKTDTKAAAEMVDRAAQLPGLTGAQVTVLTGLKADLAWDESRADLSAAGQSLDNAVRKLEIVKQTQGAHAPEAAEQAAKIRQIREELRPLLKQ